MPAVRRPRVQIDLEHLIFTGRLTSTFMISGDDLNPCGYGGTLLDYEGCKIADEGVP